ncbi:ANL family adenylate-forming protein [Helicobacter kayseriensis]|uniref:ANL family adenylate-forming protein n=1 Tax=Helicobacter kayseriensis TaxID=2905877 RepID=UPI001E54C6B8|nr:fatty acid--CoA ligase family protein [Helicobacter kayseriensis]MCE3046678.1 fatty acid--CoA ligase family protein [Helicobacter kayseriensis]MCE3048020.1 fatty acid--CoA ligase family protein [Helicobacter kayseriensis]
MANLLQKLQAFGKQNALICNNQTYSYEQLLEKVSFYSLQTKILPPHSRVVIHDDYSLDSIAIFIALMTHKHTIIPIISDQELQQKQSECSANFIFSKENNYSPTPINAKQKDNFSLGEHSGLILFSSGSTGKPKAMIHNLDELISRFNNKKPKQLNMLLFLMFDHIGGINTLLNILSTGQTAIIPQNRKDVHHIAHLIEQYQVTILPTSPTFLNLILLNKVHLTHDLSSLKMITYGTESMPQSLLSRLQEAFPKTKFLQTFGTSETGIMQTSSEKSGSLFMKISDPSVQYKVVNNELWIKSPTQVLGYLNASMESFEDGYFKTGDLVETKLINGEEYIRIIGRSKELINVGGEKVLPQEIEGIILQIDGVMDCLVYGESNPITGQSVSCDVIIDKEKINQNDIKKIIRSFCKDKIERYKIPSKVTPVTSLSFSERFKKTRQTIKEENK